MGWSSLFLRPCNCPRGEFGFVAGSLHPVQDVADQRPARLLFLGILALDPVVEESSVSGDEPMLNVPGAR